MSILRTDVALVGAGPIGLELAVALKKAGIDYQHFDASQIGHTVSWFAPGTRFFSSSERIAIAGVPLQTADQGKASREEYLSYLRGVVLQFDLKIHTYERVVGIERRAGEFLLTTRSRGEQRQWQAKRIVLATGGTDRPRRLGIPGEDLPHVGHYFQDPHAYFRKKLLIVGGKNSAVEAALRCHHAGAHVSLSYRRSELSPKSIKYWLLPEINDLIRAGRIGGYFNTAPTEIGESHVTLARVEMPSGDGETEGGRDGEIKPGTSAVSPSLPPSVSCRIESDFVLLLVGYEQDNSLLRLAGVELSGESLAPKFDERTMQSNVPGIYLAGTAVAGTQDRFRVFIENCHVHVDRILAALTGTTSTKAAETIALPES